MHSATLLAILVLMSFTGAVAQERPVQPGQRVRVEAPYLGIKRQVAVFEALHGDTLVARADTTVRYPLPLVTRIEVSRGRRSDPWPSAGIGVLLAAVAGGVVGYDKCYSNEPGWGPDPDPPDCTALYVLGAGVAGGVLGWAIGDKLIKTERWEEVPLDRLRVSLVPRRDGFGLRASIAF